MLSGSKGPLADVPPGAQARKITEFTRNAWPVFQLATWRVLYSPPKKGSG
jgi:hypothetical protein